MTTAPSLNGQCLCGAVHVSATPANHHVSACHCTMCRRWSGGGPALALEGTTPPVFTGQENISVYRSSDWAERGFCSKCGTHLFYRTLDNSFHSLPIGLFDDLSTFTLENEIFIDEKPAFYSFAEKTHTMTGAEVFALFAEAKTEQPKP